MARAIEIDDSMPSIHYKFRILPAVLFLGVLLGCTQMEMNQAISWFEEDPVATPTKVTAIWTDTVLYRANKFPIRGFGGRLMFYGPEDDKPVKVAGTLVVVDFVLLDGCAAAIVNAAAAEAAVEIHVLPEDIDR